VYSRIGKGILGAAFGLALVFCLAPANRVSASSDAEKRGQELFTTKGCPRCHGPNGVGGRKGPDLQLVRKRRSRESMVDQIRDGGKEMPAVGTSLSSGEIDDLVRFLRAKRKVIGGPPPQQGQRSSVDPQQSDTN